MKMRVCDVDASAVEKLPEHTDDKSGIGVHYVDAFIKPIRGKLEDGSRIRCKRKGLKIQLALGDKSGDGLMRRIEVSSDPITMLTAALEEAASNAGITISIEDGAIWVEF